MSGFIVHFKKDIYNEEYLSGLGLNERQKDAILFFKSAGEITSSEYKNRYTVTDRTARRDLSELIEKALLLKKGENKFAKYVYATRPNGR